KAGSTFFIEDIVRGQWTPGERDSVILRTANQDRDTLGGLVTVWAEQGPGSGGVEGAQATGRVLGRGPGGAEGAARDQATSAGPSAAQVEGGNVRLVRGGWNRAYVEELALFPMGKFDDQVDSSSGAFSKLAARRERKPGWVGKSGGYL